MVVSVACTAQGHGTGGLRGTVYCAGAQALPYAQLVVENQATHAKRTVATDSKGEYSVALLPPGIYSITANASGYMAVTTDDAVVTVSETSAVDFHLPMADHGQIE